MIAKGNLETKPKFVDEIQQINRNFNKFSRTPTFGNLIHIFSYSSEQYFLVNFTVTALFINF